MPPPSSAGVRAPGADSLRPRRSAQTGAPLLQVSPLRLLELDRLEERFEVPLAEAAGAFALDDLEEDGGAIFERLAEELQQIPLLILVDEDVELADPLHRLLDLADARRQIVVVRLRDG